MGAIWEWEKVFIVCFYKGWGKTYFGQWKRKKLQLEFFLTRTEQVMIVLKCLCIRLVE